MYCRVRSRYEFGLNRNRSGQPIWFGWDNRNRKPKFRFFFFAFHALARLEERGFYNRLNLLGVTQRVFFMVPEETQTSTSPTATGITSGTPCGGGDGPSSTVLGSSGHESTDSNTASVVSTTSGTHVVHGCNTVTAERQNVKQSVSPNYLIIWGRVQDAVET